MTPKQFKEALEKLKLRTPRTAEVLMMVLAGHTDAEIALSMDIHKGTVRKHIEKVYAAFGIKSKFEGDRRSKRGELAALFAESKHESVSVSPHSIIHEFSYAREQVDQNGGTRPASSTTKDNEGEEDLMSLATSMLDKLGFYDKFEENRTSKYLGYRLKNIRKESRRYQLLLSQQKEDLYICIEKSILKPYVLSITYNEERFIVQDEYGNIDIVGGIVTAGTFWVLPSKEDIFLETMESKYPSLLKGEVVGTIWINNEGSIDPDYFDEIPDNGDSCLHVIENKLFPYTGQVCISSREVLQ